MMNKEYQSSIAICSIFTRNLYGDVLPDFITLSLSNKYSAVFILFYLFFIKIKPILFQDEYRDTFVLKFFGSVSPDFN